MKSAVRRAGFRPLTCGRWHILLRPAAVKIAAVALLVILLLALFGLTRGSFPMPSGTLFRALLGADIVGEQQRFILFDIRLPRLFMALLCGAMLGLAGAAMQSITRNGLADPGLIGVKEGASIVVLALVLFFPAVGLVWRPLAGMLGGVLVALLVLALARDCSRPRFILIGIGVSWTLGGGGGNFIDHRRRARCSNGDDLAGGQPARGDLAAVGRRLLLGTARGADPFFDRQGRRCGAARRPHGHRSRRTPAAANPAALFRAGAADLRQRFLRRKPRLRWPDGAAYGAVSAARRPGGAALRQRVGWRAAGVSHRYNWPTGFRAAADPCRDRDCAGRLSVFYRSALASP